MLRKYVAVALVWILVFAAFSGCGRNLPQSQTDPSIAETAPQGTQTGTYYTVTFLDHSGNAVDIQQVEAGHSAVSPAYTPEEGYRFLGWNRDFSCITQDTVIDAIYSVTSTKSLMVLDMKARAGELVSVPVVIVANPGIAGAKITILCDPDLTLQSAQSGEAFSALDYTGPGQLMAPCSFTWDSESGMATEDGEILRLTFQVPENAPLGKTYAIKCVYTQGDIYNENLEDVSLGVINGLITVE